MKKDFLDELRLNLEKLEVNDIDEVINYFDEMIEDKKENGIDEEVILDNLDNPKEIAFILKGQEERAKNNEVEVDDDIARENEYISDIIDIRDIKFADINCFIEITLSEDDNLHFIYPKDVEFVVKNYKNKLSIERDDDQYKNYNKYVNLKLQIPSTYKDELKVELVNGDITINNQNLNYLKIETVSGKLTINDSFIDELKIETVNNSVELNYVRGNDIDIESVNGKVETIDLAYNFIKFESVNGKGHLRIDGLKEEYAIKVEKMFNDYKERMHLKDKKYLKIESAMGKVDYEFID